MTFTTTVKEEISKNEINYVDGRLELSAFVSCVGKVQDDTLYITLENASVARKIYKEIKMVFGIAPLVTVRVQRRFRVKQIYILSVKKYSIFKDKLITLADCLNNELSFEERVSFLQGIFLAIGNISNPKTSGYHLEFICSGYDDAVNLIKLLESVSVFAKMVERGYKHVIYIKSSDSISDLIKLFKAKNSLFYFEDVRIYKDHKNSVNRLNNCELSNQTKILETGIKQINKINYLEEHNLLDLVDEKTKIVLEARKKYPESSLSELAEIITIEYGYKIGKSGVNHHFIKVNKIIEKYMDKKE